MLLFVGVLVSLYSARHDTVGKPEVPPASFATPEAVNAYLGEWGLACAHVESAAEPVGGALAWGTCTAAGEDVAIGIYASHAEVTAQWDIQSKRLKGITRVNMVLGGNYTLTGPDAWTVQAADALRAELRTQPI
jgi:hypothetical protein